MKIGKESKNQLLAVFIGTLMLLTPHTTAQLYATLVNQPKVYTFQCTKTIKVEGRVLQFNGLSAITEYANGTKQIHLSVDIYNISSQFQRLRVNLTRIVSPADTETEERYIQSSYTGPLIEELWDNVHFVLAPGNASIWVKYDHPNNYWRNYLYPKLFNLRWILPPGAHGNTKFFLHLAQSDVYDWKTQAKSRDEILNLYIRGTSVGIAIIGNALAAYIAFTMQNIWGLILGIIISALSTLIGWLLEVLGYSSESQYVEEEVETENGDGFCYMWGFRTVSSDALIVRPPVLYIATRNDIYRIFQYHRVGVLFYEKREFKISWGAERDNPSTCTAEFWYLHWFNPGVFGFPDEYLDLIPW